MRYFTRSLLAAVLAPLAISAVPTRRDADLRADQVPRECLSRLESLSLTRTIDDCVQHWLRQVPRAARQRRPCRLCMMLGTVTCI